MSLLYGIGSVLMLHRVQADSREDFRPNRDMAVSPEFLERFIADAQQRGHTFVSLDRICDALQAGTGRQLLALTFDDGYRDNFTLAYPMLKRLGIPFTVYVTTSFPDDEAILWWYAIEQMLQQQDEIALADGSVLPCRSSQEKLDAFVSLRQLIMALPVDRLGDRVNALFEHASFDWRNICAAQALRWTDIDELASDPLVSIGAHTVSHPVLCALPEEQVRAEMRDGRERIEAHIGAPVTHFCYPFGSRNEVGAREFELARQLGFKTATTTRWGNIFPRHRKHLHGLPRVPLTNAFDWNGFRRQSLRRFSRGRVVTV
ncbi:polysaccharide deacetylase family protein [Lacisediminimonas sp.]|uniref:polysaccharide deacetylase family protein n=1 Tax=Lacisediminimonas sp. TaxID=3060582 RepID=UPI00272756D2|nr:polysaccharide deacetylase family protein [Lacisediminimonas sp.]MDO8298810.1 polysaccharide deacetylase family protein [Lacisediminimonas sp.]